MTIKGFEDWVSLGGKTRNYKNTRTGEVITRWEFDRRRLGATRRQIAKESKRASPEEFYARPARGRKSNVKAATEVKRDIAQVFQQRAETSRIFRDERKLLRTMGKKPRPIKARPSNLKPGHAAYRMGFSDAAQLREILTDARNYKVNTPAGSKSYIVAFAIILRGYDERAPERGELDVTVQRLTDIHSPRLWPDETDLQDYVDGSYEERPYFVPVGWSVHLAVDNNYLAERRKRDNLKNLKGKKK